MIKGISEELNIPNENVTGNLLTTEDGKYEIMVKEDNQIEVVKKGEGFIDALYKEEAPSSDFRYGELEDGTIRIYEYLGTDTSLNIPSTIEGKAVTEIRGDKELKTHYIGSSGSGTIIEYGGNIATNVKLKSLKIPDTVTTIGISAFEKNEIENVEISKNLNAVEKDAFRDNKIKKLKLPEGISEIPTRAFYSNQIEEVEFSSTITNIGDNAFSNNKIKILKLPDNIMTVGIGAFATNKIEYLQLPNHITSIGDAAFKDNSIKKLEIPSSVTEIGEKAFYNNQLTEINIPSTVITLGGGAFTANNIESVLYDISEGQEDRTVINSYTGKNAGDFIVPNGVIRLKSGSFFYCGLNSIILPEGLTTLEQGSIWEENLRSIVLPSSVNNMEPICIYVEKDIEYLEFKSEVPCTAFMPVSVHGSVGTVRVPYSTDHSILEAYKSSINDLIYTRGEINVVDE